MDPIDQKNDYYNHDNYYNDRQQYYNNSFTGEFETQFMLWALIFISCGSSLIHLFNSCNCVTNCKLFYSYYKIKERSLEESLIQDNLSDNCSICLENYLKNDKIIKLDCDHIFHKKCLKKWFKILIDKSEDLNCPLCRNNLF